MFTRDFDATTRIYKGVVLEDLDGDDTLTNIKQDKDCLLSYIIKNLEERFKGYTESPVVTASKIFQAKNWPTLEEIETDGMEEQAYGVPELKILHTHFQHLRCMEEFNLNQAMQEWFLMKITVHKMERRHQDSFAAFWQYFLSFSQHRSECVGFPNVNKIIRCLLITVVDTSCCERGFSLMNRIHTGGRNRLSLKTLEHLMRISLNGPSVEHFDPHPVLLDWNKIRNRTKTKTKPIRTELRFDKD